MNRRASPATKRYIPPRRATAGDRQQCSALRQHGGDEREHAPRLGERQRLAVLRLAAFGIELVGMGCNIAEQVKLPGREPVVPQETPPPVTPAKRSPRPT
jgi:hypothetical protein